MSRTFSASAGLAGLLILVVATPDKLTHSPAEGLVLRKSFELRSTSETRSFGKGELEWTTESTGISRLVVRDEVLQRDATRVRRLRRTYEEIGAQLGVITAAEGESYEDSMPMVSLLEGETVDFEWNAGIEEYEPRCEELDQHVLDELAFDLDFLGFLPERDVQPGDAWKIEPETLEQLTRLWSRHRLRPRGSEEGREASPPPDVEETSAVTGEVIATLTEISVRDGLRFAVLTMAGSLETRVTQESNREEERTSLHNRSESVRFEEIRGELTWNLSGGHLHGLELATRSRNDQATTGRYRIGDRETVTESRTEDEGTSTLTVRFGVD